MALADQNAADEIAIIAQADICEKLLAQRCRRGRAQVGDRQLSRQVDWDIGRDAVDDDASEEHAEVDAAYRTSGHTA